MIHNVISINQFPTLNKVEVNIRITNKAKELDLYRLGQKLREGYMYKNVYIFYYLPEMEISNGAYATTHFNENSNGDVVFTGI